MSVEIVQELEVPATVPDWEPDPPPTDLIFDDGEPLETHQHRMAMNVLIRSLDHAWRDRCDYFAGGNMFIYFSNKQVFNKDFRGPDFFVVLDVESNFERQGWVVWEENGRYPDVIVELMSSSTANIDRTVKKDLYERTFRTSNYFIFNPFDAKSLEGWHLGSDRRYHTLVHNERGWLWSETLELWLGTWEGEIGRVNSVWLRFFDRDGNLILLPEEDAQAQAEQAQQQAEQAQQQAEQAQQQAEQAQQQAEQERQRADRLAAQLRKLGIDPDGL